jgi:hypothetical protein
MPHAALARQQGGRFARVALIRQDAGPHVAQKVRHLRHLISTAISRFGGTPPSSSARETTPVPALGSSTASSAARRGWRTICRRGTAEEGIAGIRLQRVCQPAAEEPATKDRDRPDQRLASAQCNRRLS